MLGTLEGGSEVRFVGEDRGQSVEGEPTVGA